MLSIRIFILFILNLAWSGCFFSSSPEGEVEGIKKINKDFEAKAIEKKRVDRLRFTMELGLEAYSSCEAMESDITSKIDTINMISKEF